jgi:hypothetical protein
VAHVRDLYLPRSRVRCRDFRVSGSNR